MKSAIELIQEKHNKNLKRFPYAEQSKYQQFGELKQAAIFTLNKDYTIYPKNWHTNYLFKTLEEQNEIENLINAAALIVAQIEVLRGTTGSEAGEDEK